MTFPTPLTKASPFLVTLLKIQSILFVAPFYLTKCQKTECIVFVRPKFKTIIAAIIHSFFVILHFLRIVSALGNYLKVRHDISSTFYTASQLSATGAIIWLQWILWKNQDDLEKLVEMTNFECSKQKAFRSQLLTLFIFVAIAASSIIHGLLTDQMYFYPDHIYNLLKSTISPVTQLCGFDLIDTLKNGISENIWMVLNRIMSSVGLAVSNGIIISVLIVSLALNHVLEDHFHQNIKDSYNNIPKFLELYDQMKEISKAFKIVFGPFVLCFYIASLAFFAMVSHVLLSKSEGIARLLMGGYATGIVFSFVLASKAHSLIDQDLKQYISHHHWEYQWNTKEQLQLIALTQEMEKEPIALSGCFFAITRHFLSSTCGLMITYSLLVFQTTSSENAFWEKENNKL